MVGDGILNVTLRSPVPLNDNEWHFVQAELNVKLARIKVDYQPWAVRRFPGQTFVTMEFTHPLLVGTSPGCCGWGGQGGGPQGFWTSPIGGCGPMGALQHGKQTFFVVVLITNTYLFFLIQNAKLCNVMIN